MSHALSFSHRVLTREALCLVDVGIAALELDLGTALPGSDWHRALSSRLAVAEEVRRDLLRQVQDQNAERQATRDAIALALGRTPDDLWPQDERAAA